MNHAMTVRNRRAISRFRTETQHPTIVRMLQVAHCALISHRLVRLVLAGPQLGAFADAEDRHPAVTSTGFDDVVILFFPQPGSERITVPKTSGDGGFARPLDPNVIFREYTVRHLDEAGLVVDVVLHDSGIASDWARQAESGMSIGVVGPRVSRALPRLPKILAIGDATALPSLSRLSESLGDDVEGDVIIVDGGPDLEMPLSAPTRLNIVRARNAAAAHSLLAGMDLDPDRTYAWLAGESGLVTSLRSHLLSARDFAKDHVQCTGYWRI
ncbi:siderophore-interacting protein [Rhodococcus sp. H36-A4]|uniref:siderophore-interacting protein n=1 Tax=Rhodococcus sp. H36-A4 TaxID=3004353 RepID=UPI0022AF5CB3|nr:siderophore-interacting protein [Rhodococcus sp. H36-A4]MCZ4079177.1 siderophore-interacting protein [Rhodococcus sp. H36-A4]